MTIVSKLPAGEVIAQHYTDGLSYSEIGALYGVTIVHPDGRRNCRACRRIYQAGTNARRRS